MGVSAGFPAGVRSRAVGKLERGFRAHVAALFGRRAGAAEPVVPGRPLPFVVQLLADWAGWLRRAEVAPGAPFLPLFEYDVVLNEFFQGAEMLGDACTPRPGTRGISPRS
jgi:hypothetical protein